MAEWKFYSDAALLNEITSLKATTYPDTTFRVFYGSTDDTMKIEAQSDPGVDDLQIMVEDTTPGSGHETTAVKLADSESGLTSAVSGDPIVIGTFLNGGAGGAFEFWVRVTDAIHDGVKDTTLSLRATPWTESAV